MEVRFDKESVRLETSMVSDVNNCCCWHVDYENLEQFHMDVIPSYDDTVAEGEQIKITDHDEDHDIYRYIGSTPKGYLNWFFGRCQQRQQALMEAYSLQNGGR